MRTKHIVIVGGGISGLAAAWQLQQSGLIASGAITVTLLEASTRLGGKIQTHHITTEHGTFVIESGPDAMLTTKPWAKDLSSALGLEAQHIGTNQQQKTLYVWHNNALHTMPAGMYLVAPTQISSILKSTLLSWRGKFDLLFERFRAPKPDTNDESLIAFLTRRFGSEVAHTIGIPLMAGIYNADPQRQSMQATFPQMLSQEREYGSITNAILSQLRKPATQRSGGIFFSLPDGVQQLVDTLTTQLTQVNMLLESPVCTIEHHNNQYHIHTPTTTIQADHVILATPARIAASLLKSQYSELSNILAMQEYVSTGTISLAFMADALEPAPAGFGVLYSTNSKRQFNAITISSIKFSHRAPNGHLLFRLFFGGQHQQGMLDLTDEQLTDLAIQELKNVLGVVGTPLLSRVSRYPHANPQYNVGHQTWLRTIDEHLPPQLTVTGSSYRGIGIPDCVNDATRTANSLIAHLQGATR
jgi:oxygen-dependent protoporphyrinogen oxidase